METSELISRLETRHKRIVEPLSKRNDDKYEEIVNSTDINDGFRLLHACLDNGVTVRRYSKSDERKSGLPIDMYKYETDRNLPQYGCVLLNDYPSGDPKIGFVPRFYGFDLGWCHDASKIILREDTCSQHGVLYARMDVSTKMNGITVADPLDGDGDVIAERLDAEYTAMCQFELDAIDFVGKFKSYVTRLVDDADRRTYDCDFALMDAIGADREDLL